MPEDDPDTLKTIWTANNELKAVKVGTKVALPKDPEELRKRVTVLGTAWMFVGFQQTHKAYLKGLTPQCFTEYLTYLLGEHVLGLGAKDSAGNLMAYPPWSLVLSYEHALRTKAISLVKKGAMLKDALKSACEDPLTKERNFTTPFCLGTNRKRTADFSAPSHPPSGYPAPRPSTHRRAEARAPARAPVRQNAPARAPAKGRSRVAPRGRPSPTRRPSATGSTTPRSGARSA